MKILLNQSNAHQSGIYAIKTTNGSKVYVGSTRDFMRRASNHRSSLIRNKHVNPILQHHVNKYGIDDIIFEVLLVCNLEDLLIEEQRFIDEIAPQLNIKVVSGGGSPKGEGCGKSKLTDAAVSEIKCYLNNGNTCKSIALIYGVSRECIMDIKKGRTWTHI